MPDLGAGLTEAAADFAADGWVSLPEVTTAAEIEWLRGLYDELFATRAGEETGQFFDLGSAPGAGTEVLPQIMDPQQRHPELNRTTYFLAARLIASRLLGVAEEELVHFSHMILKPAGYGRETPWHQDEAYWDPNFDHEAVSVWMPLEDASVDSGCMQFIPGSHAGPVRPHRHIDDDPRVHGLVTDDVDPRQAVACPLPAGAVCVHHCRMVHYAGPNLTGRPRRAYIHVFSAPPRPRTEPHPRPWLRRTR